MNILRNLFSTRTGVSFYDANSSPINQQHNYLHHLYSVASIKEEVLWYEAGADQRPSRTIGINPEVCIRRTKLIGNQLDLLVVYIASCFPLNKQYN